MTHWIRAGIAIIAGFIAWFAVAAAGNLVIRWLIPSYTEVEEIMDFSLTMMIARLVLGGISSVVAGVACAVIAREVRWPIYLFGLLLLMMFVPVHMDLWTTFPLWYHLIFLGTLLPLIVLGGVFVNGRSVTGNIKEKK